MDKFKSIDNYDYKLVATGTYNKMSLLLEKWLAKFGWAAISPKIRYYDGTCYHYPWSELQIGSPARMTQVLSTGHPHKGDFHLWVRTNPDPPKFCKGRCRKCDELWMENWVTGENL